MIRVDATDRWLPGGKYWCDYIDTGAACPAAELKKMFEDWIKSCGGTLVEAGDPHVIFENEHDAIIFKLKYML